VAIKLPKLIAPQRFADPGLERRYRHEQRNGQARYVSWLVLIALIGIAIYWLSNFVLLDVAAALTIVAKQAMLVAILVLFAWVIRRPLYADAWWLDVLLFAMVLPFQFSSLETMLATQSTGWTLPGLLTYGVQATMACACLVFAAAVRSFFFLALLSGAFLFTALTLRGYPAQVVSYTTYNYVFFAGIVCFLNLSIDRKARAAFLARTNLAAERARSEQLLGNMLPSPVAERLKANEAIADSFADIVVVFVDLVGFTTLSQKLGPQRIVELLNAFFARADRATDLFGLEKVKTIGDAYMAVAGALVPTPRPAKAAVDFAVHLREQARAAGAAFGVDLHLHVGIARGPAIGGVTGAKRLTYDYWGHTVNLAARLQDSVGADGIAVSEAVWQAVRDSYSFHPAREVALKGVGSTPVHDLDLAAE